MRQKSDVIRAARKRLEERQRQADIARGRSDDDAPPDGGDKPKKKSRFKSKFGERKPDAQENLTDPESRIMKHAGGGFDYSYNAQAAVDETAHIIVAAELGNSAADSGQLPIVLEAVASDAGAAPRQVLANAGYRSEATFEQLREHPAELIVALGREGKKDVKVDAKKRPLCAAMAEKLTSAQTQAAYRKSQMVVRTAERLGKKRSRISTIQHARTGQGPGRVETRLRGAEPAQNVENDVCVSPEKGNFA